LTRMVARSFVLGYKHCIAFLSGSTFVYLNPSESSFATIIVRKGRVLSAAYGTYRDCRTCFLLSWHHKIKEEVHQ
jgi:hypothetical protein